MADHTYTCANPDCDESRNALPWTASGYPANQTPNCPWCSQPMRQAPAPERRIEYGCRHSKPILGHGPAVITAPHLCPPCAREELSNPFQGAFGFHIHTVDLQAGTAAIHPNWCASREQALNLALSLKMAPDPVQATIEACPGPQACSVDDHGDQWVEHIAHLAYIHEAHGSGWTTVCIDDYYAASARQQALAPCAAG